MVPKRPATEAAFQPLSSFGDDLTSPLSPTPQSNALLSGRAQMYFQDIDGGQFEGPSGSMGHKNEHSDSSDAVPGSKLKYAPERRKSNPKGAPKGAKTGRDVPFKKRSSVKGVPKTGAKASSGAPKLPKKQPRNPLENALLVNTGFGVNANTWKRLSVTVVVFTIFQLLGGGCISNPGQDCHCPINKELPGQERYPERKQWPKGSVRKEVKEAYKNKFKGLQSFRGEFALWPCAYLNSMQIKPRPCHVHPEQVDHWYSRFLSEDPPTYEDLKKARGNHKCEASKEKYAFVLEHCKQQRETSRHIVDDERPCDKVAVATAKLMLAGKGNAVAQDNPAEVATPAQAVSARHGNEIDWTVAPAEADKVAKVDELGNSDPLFRRFFEAIAVGFLSYAMVLALEKAGDKRRGFVRKEWPGFMPHDTDPVEGAYKPELDLMCVTVDECHGNREITVTIVEATRTANMGHVTQQLLTWQDAAERGTLQDKIYTDYLEGSKRNTDKFHFKYISAVIFLSMQQLFKQDSKITPNETLWSIMARTQGKFEVKPCAFLLHAPCDCQQRPDYSQMKMIELKKDPDTNRLTSTACQPFQKAAQDLCLPAVGSLTAVKYWARYGTGRPMVFGPQNLGDVQDSSLPAQADSFAWQNPEMYFTQLESTHCSSAAAGVQQPLAQQQAPASSCQPADPSARECKRKSAEVQLGVSLHNESCVVPRVKKPREAKGHTGGQDKHQPVNPEDEQNSDGDVTEAMDSQSSHLATRGWS